MSGKRKAKSSSNGSNVKRGHWSQGLKQSMEDPDLIVETDERIVIIKDKYPKAKYHFLVLPKVSIPNLKALTHDHIDLLKHMHEKGLDLAARTDSKAEFRLGYHAVPSMSHLHLHVISQDFDSPCLKTKKHWNSYNTDYFIDSKSLIDQLKADGAVNTMSSRESEELLKRALKCHKCGAEFLTLPKLKTHIVRHAE